MNDRGNKKWGASFMLPQHLKLLNQVFKEAEYKEKPILDVQEQTEINAKLQVALQNYLTVEIKHYFQYDFLYIKGKIDYIDSVEHYLQLDDEEKTQINFENIIGVTIL